MLKLEYINLEACFLVLDKDPISYAMHYNL